MVLGGVRWLGYYTENISKKTYIKPVKVSPRNTSYTYLQPSALEQTQTYRHMRKLQKPSPSERIIIQTEAIVKLIAFWKTFFLASKEYGIRLTAVNRAHRPDRVTWFLFN